MSKRSAVGTCWAVLLAVSSCEDQQCQARAHRDAIVAQLQVGTASPFDLEVTAERIVAVGGTEFEADRMFLLGVAAFQRCRQTADQAGGPEAEPSAYAIAIRHAEHARDRWQEAIVLRGGEWPVATRNAALAERALSVLTDRQAAAERAQSTRQVSTATDAESRVFVPRELLDRVLDRLDRRELERLAQKGDEPTLPSEVQGW